MEAKTIVAVHGVESNSDLILRCCCKCLMPKLNLSCHIRIPFILNYVRGG